MTKPIDAIQFKLIAGFSTHNIYNVGEVGRFIIGSVGSVRTDFLPCEGEPQGVPRLTIQPIGAKQIVVNLDNWVVKMQDGSIEVRDERPDL